MNMVFPVADPVTPLAAAPAILAAANLLLPHLERGQRVDAVILRGAMETAFGASDATGAWDWKLAYEACEVATVLFLRKYGKALFRKAATPAARISVLAKIAGLLPTQTRRSEESQNFQQFSTPIPLGLAALTAAAITPDDRVLEPSAGTGLLAILAQTIGGSLILNELADTRAELLAELFPAFAVNRFDAAQIDDHLAPDAVPSVVLMNPPFSVMANVSGRVADAAYRHVASALARLAPGGRLVTMTGAGFGPEAPAWRDAFIRLQARGRVVFSAAVDGAVSDIFDALISTMADTSLDFDLDEIMWSTVNTFHRAVERIERKLDDNEQAQKRLQREQDGSEVKSVQLETLIGAGQSLIERRDSMETFRDAAADIYLRTTGTPWSQRSGSRVNHRQMTSAMIDSRDFIAAKRRADNEVLLPAGPKIAFSGGDTTDHRTIWSKLDQVHAKHPDMVLMHGGSPKGAERIAATWANNRKVAQVAFKPDWAKHAKAAPFKRNDQMLGIMPIGVIIFPGTGIQDNLADKARKMGIPVYRFGTGSA